jgi:hypothetical protein
MAGKKEYRMSNVVALPARSLQVVITTQLESLREHLAAARAVGA